MLKAIAKLGGEEIVIELPEGCCLADLKKKLDPKWQENVLVVVNGKIAQNGQVFNKSDRIRIFPIMAGG